MFLRFFPKFTGKQACNFIKKETSATVLSCELCETFKNVFLTEYLRTTASSYKSCYLTNKGLYLKSLEKQSVSLSCYCFIHYATSVTTESRNKRLFVINSVGFSDFLLLFLLFFVTILFFHIFSFFFLILKFKYLLSPLRSVFSH